MLAKKTNETKSFQTFEPVKADCTLVVVSGLHMRGFPLEKQMNELAGRFVRDAVTAAKYQFIKLPTEPVKPGLFKNSDVGASIQVEIWEIPLTSSGVFVASFPAPLGIVKLELLDGEEVPGFICESYVAKDGEDT